MIPDEDDIRYMLAGLADVDPQTRAVTAGDVASRPTGDGRVSAALARLLGDATAVRLMAPSLHGELRVGAAAALAAERRAAGDLEPVRVRCAPAVVCRDAATFERLRPQLDERDLALRAPVDWADLIVRVPSDDTVPVVARPAGGPADGGDFVAALDTGALEDRVVVLQVLMQSPTGDAAIRGAVERRLDDRSIARLLIPARYGELRLLAAAALAAERHAAGERAPVELRAPPLLSGEALTALARQAGLPEARAIEQYARLRDRGLLAERRFEIGFPAELAWL